jgi:hypothetical protein
VGESASYLSLPSSLASRRAEKDASGDPAAAPNRRGPRDSAREQPLLLQRQDTAFDADQLKDFSRVSRASPPGTGTGARLATEKEKEVSDENFSEAFLRSPSPGETDDGTSAREREATPTRMEKTDAGDAPGVLEALLAAGAAVRALSLDERKELFEVAVQEQVAALTHQLFPPEDGLNPRVHVDVAV